MYEDLSVAYLDIEREADLLLSGLAMATRSTGSMMHVLSTGKQSNEADRLTRDNSTPSSAGSERIHSPDGFGERQGASLSPSRVKPALSDEEAALEREIRLLSVSNFNSGEMSGFDVNKRSCENVSCPKDGSKDLETKKNLKKLANRWKHFADSYGYCVECGKEVMDAELGCEALGKVYHTKCFKCKKCGAILVGKMFFSIQGNIFCEKDYLETFEKCYKCKEPITDKIIRALGEAFHHSCFKCSVCEKKLDGVPFTVDAYSQLYCVEDFNNKYAPKCGACKKPVIPVKDSKDNFRIVAMNESFHPQCYKCEDCNKSLIQQGEGCYPLDNLLLCRDCNSERIQTLTSTLL